MKETYVPSGRFDSGMTRSRVRGSTAIPAVVFSGLRGGLDIGYKEQMQNDNNRDSGSRKMAELEII
jgi:hypothetical protein